MLRRRGFTLVEIVLALVIMLMVSGALHRLLFSTQRLTRKQLEQVALQSSLRAGSLVVVNELRELSTRSGGTADENDILRIAPSGVTYRAMRGIGFICQASSAGTIRIDRARFTGHRDPRPGRDMAYVFVPGDPGKAVPDSWLGLAITGVTNAVCPGTRGPGMTLTVSEAGAETGVELGTPVRIAEVMELRLYQSDGQSWLGARSVSAGEPIQPVVGPLAEAAGFRLEYLTGAGTPTTDPSSVKSVKVTLRGQVKGHLEEELITQVTLRNSFRQ